MLLISRKPSREMGCLSPIFPRRGFTLLEMLVASAIMAAALVGLMAGLSGSTRNAARLRDYDRVVQLARLRMNDILADDRAMGALEGTFSPEQVGGLQSGWRANVVKVQEGPDAVVGNFMLDRVELEVWWMAGETRRSFRLEGYRHRIIRP
jgi:type II secretion system protein I